MTLRNFVKTVGLQRLVEIVSPPNSPIILAFGQLIAVTKFGRRSPQTGPQIMERYCAILSRCVRGISRKRCKIVTIADHSNQKSYLWRLVSSVLSRDNACVYLNWHQRRQTCWVLRREVWRSTCFHQQCAAAAVVCSPWCIATTSVKFPLNGIEEVRQMMTRSPCQKFRSRQKQWRVSIEDWRQLGLRTPCEKFLATPLTGDRRPT